MVLLLLLVNFVSGLRLELMYISPIEIIFFVLPVFPSRTNLKVYNTSVTPKMVQKVIMNLVLSKASGPDCIPSVVLMNCEPELSYTLAELLVP